MTLDAVNWTNAFSNFESFSSAPNTDTASLYFTPLENYQFLQAKGEDDVKFLQGQLTCDIALLKKNRVLLGAHCNPKGRMTSHFLTANHSHTITLKLHRAIIEDGLKALKKYSVFSKIEITQNTDLVGITCWGNTQTLEALLTTTLPELGMTTTTSLGTLSQPFQGIFEIWLSIKDIPELAQKLAGHALKASENHLSEQLIQRGIAELRAESIETFVPHEINLPQVGGVSFDKGCYTGQEIVARMEYRGQLKKHMYRARITLQTNSPALTIEKLAPNTPLYNENQALLGKIIIGTMIDTGLAEILVLTSDSNVGTVLSGQLDEQTPVNIEWAPLPYNISKSQ